MSKQNKVLLFEGAGMNFYDDKDKMFSDVGNHRIRTAFINNDNQHIYIELGHCRQYVGKSKTVYRLGLRIDHLFNISISSDSNISSIKTDFIELRDGYEYTKTDIIKWINKNLNCSFTDIQVLSNFEGYRVHGDNNTYNLMDDHILNPKRTVARLNIYNKTVSIHSKIRQYPCISVMKMTDKYMILRFNSTAQDLLKLKLKSPDVKYYVKY
jgi:hypothetical protein